MQRLRTSASDIDAWRRYLNPPIPDMEIELSDLLSQLRRESPPTDAMLAGSALHAALERADAGDHATLEANGYTFHLDMDGEIDLPEMREIKGTRDYAIGDCTVTLVGQVDAIHGRRIEDHKFTSRFDAERFMSSYQWRIYLEVFGADTFRWNVFEGSETEPMVYRIYGFHQPVMHRYPGMGDDVVKAVAGFLDFARTHLPERVG
jgi:hypothetical protein